MKKEVFLLVLILSLPLASALEIKEIFTIQKDLIKEDSALTSELGTTSYFYAGSKLIASKDSNGLEYKYQDRLGSDIESRQLPFGQELVNSGNRFEFTGKELDDKSGLNYFGARYYDSNLGRFTSIDPAKEGNPYSYVANNPMNLIDPDGKKIHLGQYYLMDTGIGDSQIAQYSYAYSDAPWYNVLEHTAVTLNNLGGTVFNMATTLLATPDMVLAALGADQSDREGVYTALFMIGWEYQMLQSATRASTRVFFNEAIETMDVTKPGMIMGRGPNGALRQHLWGDPIHTKDFLKAMGREDIFDTISALPITEQSTAYNSFLRDCAREALKKANTVLYRTDYYKLALQESGELVPAEFAGTQFNLEFTSSSGSRVILTWKPDGQIMNVMDILPEGTQLGNFKVPDPRLVFRNREFLVGDEEIMMSNRPRPVE